MCYHLTASLLPGTHKVQRHLLRTLWGPSKAEQLLQLWGTHSKEHRVVVGKASILRRQQNGHVGSMHSWSSSSNKLQEALEVEPRIKENHVVAFSHLQYGSSYKEVNGKREAGEGKLLQEKLWNKDTLQPSEMSYIWSKIWRNKMK